MPKENISSYAGQFASEADYLHFVKVVRAIALTYWQIADPKVCNAEMVLEAVHEEVR